MIRVIEIDSSLKPLYKPGDFIKKGAYLGLTSDLNGAVFSAFSGKIISMTPNIENQVVSLEIEEFDEDMLL